MADIQIAVIDEKDTQIALAVPGVQGPAGAISSGGSANQVFYKVSGTNYDAGWTFIGNANVDAAAAIAGTKISPNFGSQAIVTTGTNTAASFIPTSSSIPSNGIYLPGANQVAVATNGSARLYIASDGKVGVGTTSPVSTLTVNGIGAFGANSGSADVSAARELYIRGASNSSLISFQTSTTGSNGFLVGAIASEGRLQMVDAFPITFHTSNAERLRITDAGLVGIGTTSPGAALEINAAAATSPFIAKINTSEAARIDSSGRLLVGTSTVPTFRITNDDRTDSTHITTKSGTALGASFAVVQWAGNTAGAWGNDVVFAKSFNGTVGTHTIGSSGSLVSRLFFSASDGTRFVPAASIETFIDGTPGTNDMPGRLVFSTTADGASSPTEAMRINSQQELLVGTATRNANGGVLQLKSGITFPATAVAASNANTLDDYEEGTWTPVVSFGGASVGITGTFGGTYTKVGNVVTITFTLTFTSKGTSTGEMLVSGMPFAGTIDAISGFGYVHRLGTLVPGGQLHMQVSGTTFYPRFAGYNGVNATPLTDAAIRNDTDLRGGIVFRV